MSKREILLADSDCLERKQLADSFNAAGYQVETTDSTSHVLCSVLERQIPVVLLGSGCDKRIGMANLVPLLRKCNRKVTIILVSGEEPLPTIRTIRQEGIFYHALKPAGLEDTEELLTAVKCAFNKTDRAETKLAANAQPNRESLHGAGMPCVAAQEYKQDSEELSIRIKGNPATETVRKEKKIRVKTSAVLAPLIAALVGLAYYAVTATKRPQESGDFMMWGFWVFCALIVIGQFLPLFFSLWEARKAIEQQLQGVNDDGEKDFAALGENK